MSRKLMDHVVTSADAQLMVSSEDEKSQGNAHHHYRISGFDLDYNMVYDDSDLPADTPRNHVDIFFQHGPVTDSGVNGITQEVLLTIVLDRLRNFQAGPFSCKANACAITHIEEALHWLQQRTIERTRRGVEGTDNV